MAPRPRKLLFHGRHQHPLPGFDGQRCAAYAQQLFGLPSTLPWTREPTLPTKPLPVGPAISHEVALNHGSPWSPDASPDVTRNGTPHVHQRGRSSSVMGSGQLLNEAPRRYNPRAPG
ncbi:hypothetical protein MRX96_057777 [Rhipicephalus microplus]